MAIKKIGLVSEVITLQEARSHLRVIPFGAPLAHPDDADILVMITAAREWAEEYIQRSISTQTLELALDEFPAQFELVPYVQSVTSIKYMDVNNVEQTITPLDYVVDNYSTPAWIVPSYGISWPATYEAANTVKVRFVSGYTNGLVPNDAPCPSMIIAAMKLIIGNLYDNRQQDVLANSAMSFTSLPLGIYTMLQPYRLGLSI